MKLGIIRCMQTEDYCPGSRDFRTIRERKGAFMGEDDIQLVGFINCGGCPGKKAVLRARSLVEQGADTIAFASCISKGTPIGYPCPFAKRMRELVQKEVGDGVRILDYTHDAGYYTRADLCTTTRSIKIRESDAQIRLHIFC